MKAWAARRASVAKADDDGQRDQLDQGSSPPVGSELPTGTNHILDLTGRNAELRRQVLDRLPAQKRSTTSSNRAAPCSRSESNVKGTPEVCGRDRERVLSQSAMVCALNSARTEALVRTVGVGSVDQLRKIADGAAEVGGRLFDPEVAMSPPPPVRRRSGCRCLGYRHVAAGLRHEIVRRDIGVRAGWVPSR